MPRFPEAMDSSAISRAKTPGNLSQDEFSQEKSHSPPSTQVKNRRRRYLEQNPSYFWSPSLEFAEPLLHDLLVRQWLHPKELIIHSRAAGFASINACELHRAENLENALANQHARALYVFERSENGEITVDEERSDDLPESKEEGWDRWVEEMGQRFVKGQDDDFEYHAVDENEKWDDWEEEDREQLERWIEDEGPSEQTQEGHQSRWTGIQDY